MKKAALYILGAVILGGLLYYFLGEMGLLPLALGGAGIGAGKLKKLNEKRAEKVAELKKLEEEEKKLEKDGVKDMTPEEEAEYWKNQ